METFEIRKVHVTLGIFRDKLCRFKTISAQILLTKENIQIWKISFSIPTANVKFIFFYSSLPFREFSNRVEKWRQTGSTILWERRQL